MRSLIFVLLWSAVAARDLYEKVTPGSILQKITPGFQQPISDSLDVDQYLRTYGYMNDVNELSDEDDHEERRRDALELFQRFAGLEVTGEEDEGTIQHMLLPRCGVKDIEIGRPSNDSVGRWNVTEITYMFRTFTKDISEDSVRSIFEDVFSLWSEPTQLMFREIKKGWPIMDIRFVSGQHPPCRAKFDGRGGVLAHAYYPHRHPFGGDIHFDDAETFRYKVGPGVELASVALHEAGHALGLGHDRTRGSIMLPWYTGQTTLGPNDIRRMEMLYA